MLRALRVIRRWHRPRRSQSLFERWCRDFVLLLPTWPLGHLFLSGPWYEGLSWLVEYSFILALADYAYLHVYGGIRHG
jgi:hypothetical protein